jgi:serine/threonine protein phosphatase PrpC
MSSRLALKYGLVSEEDRLSNSSDAILVTEPTTGSKARTKGSLYLVVTSKGTGGKTRDACRLVADTIRREYYYDESAGIAIVLEKAIRASNRRLRHSREGGGLNQGAIGVAVAVVRGNELYVATAGDADSYLIRAARLLMPEHEPGEGLPAPDNVRVDVWRGDFSVGDSLVLCSRNLVEVVGTEELKNAVVTLHPQSAVEHLHHLFVAAGGEGSDAVLTIEATEVSLNRVEHKLTPVSPSEPLAGAPLKSPIPLADQVSGAASAIQDRAVAARLAVRDGFSRAVGSVLDLMPRRRTNYRRLGETAATRRETQRRAAIAILAFIALVAVLGVGVVVLDPFRQEAPINNVTEGEAALRDARDKADQVLGPADLINANPTQAQQLLHDAWEALDRAQSSGVVSQAAIDTQRARVVAGLDLLYGTVPVSPTALYSAPAATPLSKLVQGPDEAAYAIAGDSVIRIDRATSAMATIAREGDGVGVGLSVPMLLARGGPDLLIYDNAGALWRWRPSDAVGGGTLGQIAVAGDQQWGDSVVDIQTFLINPDQGLYRLYVPFPPQSQILRYDPTADGGGFSAPNPYFVSEGENVASFEQLLVDGDVYAATSDQVLRYFNGRRSGAFELPDPPDNDDLRPDHDYQLITATGTRGVGILYVWDALNSRIVAFDKTDATYVEQYVAAAGSPPLSDLTGMYVIDSGSVTVPPTLVYARPDGIYQMTLAAGDVTPTPQPSAEPTPEDGTPSATAPSASQTPEPPTPEPTVRPRRTPRPVTP